MWVTQVMTLRPRLLLLVLALCRPCPAAQPAAERFPILAIVRSEDSSILLQYTLTAEERRLSLAMDEAMGRLPDTAPREEYFRVAETLGAKFGLSDAESVAFFVRTTFSEFEPRE